MPPLHWEYVHLRTVVFLSKAKTSKYHFCSSVCIAFFWHFKKSGVSWMCIRVCLMYLLASVLSCLLCSLTWAQTLQTLGLGAPWATGVAGGGESAHALSKWQNSCLCAACCGILALLLHVSPLVMLVAFLIVSASVQCSCLRLSCSGWSSLDQSSCAAADNFSASSCTDPSAVKSKEGFNFTVFSVLLVTSSLLPKVFLNKASRETFLLKLHSKMWLFRNSF